MTLRLNSLTSDLSISEMGQVLSFDTILGSEDGGKRTSSRKKGLFQLHTGPWLCDRWGKRDIYFFQSHDGFIDTEYPFLVSKFTSNVQVSGT